MGNIKKNLRIKYILSKILTYTDLPQDVREIINPEKNCRKVVFNFPNFPDGLEKLVNSKKPPKKIKVIQGIEAGLSTTQGIYAIYCGHYPQ